MTACLHRTTIGKMRPTHLPLYGMSYGIGRSILGTD